MSIIFKESYYSEDERVNIKKNESLELSIALLERLNENDSHAIFKITPINNSPFYAVRESNLDGFRDTFTGIEGTESINYSQIKDITQLLNYDDVTINDEILNKYKLLLSNLNVLSFSKKIHDKNGEEYTIKYHSNYNICMLGAGRDDILRVYNSKNREIGSLKAIYTLEEDYTTLNPTVIHKVLDIQNNDYDIHKNSSKEELVKRFNRTQSRSHTDKDNNINIDTLYEKITQELTSKYKDELNNRHTNLATIGYSDLKDEYEDEENVSYKGKGLAQIMYFEVAKELNKKGIEFRSSTCQTNDAKKVWTNLQKNLKNNIIEIDYNGSTAYCLKVGEDENLNFINGKLKHTSINNFILNSKPKKQNSSSINKNI
jgi:hypothetical protein